jgi:hypothetical protein
MLLGFLFEYISPELLPVVSLAAALVLVGLGRFMLSGPMCDPLPAVVRPRGRRGAPDTQVQGFVAPGYESVAKMFESLVRAGWEDNAQVCAYVDGHLAVDLCGVFDRHQNDSKGYNHGSIQNCFSTTKAVTSIVMAMLVDRGHLTYDTTIASVWPAFAEHDKDDVTIEDLLKHESGLQKFAFSLTADDLQRDALKTRDSKVGAQISAAKPHHARIVHRKHKHAATLGAAGLMTGSSTSTSRAGTTASITSSGSLGELQTKKPQPVRAYHALTRGWVVNEICMRVDPQNRTVGEFVRDEITQPLDILGELTLGTETSDNAHRIAPLVAVSHLWIFLQLFNFFNWRVKIHDIIIHLFLKQVRRYYYYARSYERR